METFSDQIDGKWIFSRFTYHMPLGFRRLQLSDDRRRLGFCQMVISLPANSIETDIPPHALCRQFPAQRSIVMII